MREFEDAARAVTLHDAIAKLLRHDIGRLPAVERTAPKIPVGYLRRAGIVAARRRCHHEEDVRERGAAIGNTVRQRKVLA